MKLKMFLSDYQYRQMLLKDVAMKITELPIVKQFYHHYRVREFKTNFMNSSLSLNFPIYSLGICDTTPPNNNF